MNPMTQLNVDFEQFEIAAKGIECVAKDMTDIVYERQRERYEGRAFMPGKPKVPQFILAGGFVRDTLLGLPPKDIDVFMNAPVPRREQYLEALVQLLGEPEVENITVQPNEDEYGHLLMTWDFHRVRFPAQPLVNEDLPIEIIMTDTGGLTADKFMEKFDFGICMAGYSPKTGLHMNKKFLLDMFNKTCTLYNERNKDKHIERFDRWKDKGLDHELILSDDGDNSAFQLAV